MSNYKQKDFRRSGVTLVELSVVLVVVSLIVAGVLVAQSMIKSSRLLAVTKELHEYESAMSIFKQKFRYFPGDFPNATAYWPDAVNGNGDWNWPSAGGWHGPGPWTGSAGQFEARQVWYQLSKAGLITGSYTGSGNVDVGVNIPASSYPGGSYDVFSEMVNNENINYIEFGSLTGKCCDINNGQILNPADAHYLDYKMDDGAPGTGKLRVARSAFYNNTAGACVSGDWHAPEISYLFDDTLITCRLFWVIK